MPLKAYITEMVYSQITSLYTCTHVWPDPKVAEKYAFFPINYQIKI